jgi:hypothetical protein
MNYIVGTFGIAIVIGIALSPVMVVVGAWYLLRRRK